jgi:tetratricopeptide (TPR) repeat protein
MTTMPTDARGLAVTAASDAAADAFDHAVEGLLKYRADAGLRLQALFGLDPDMPMGHVLKGAFAMLSYNAAQLPRAREAAAAAARLAGTGRERAHAAAIGKWADGDIDGALGCWDSIMAADPHDVLAFRLHHSASFWLGRTEVMVRAVTGILPRWSAAIPGHGSVLACHCFAHEEAGNYIVAEDSGRAAVALDPADLWATHGVAHIMEMQGRRGEGIAWLRALEPNWEGGSNFLHHLWWHRAMFHIERGEHDEVLALYDRHFRNEDSALFKAIPDLHTDVQNAASTLFRLQRQGVAVGDRWVEIADKAEARIGDCLSTFTLPHWMMALAATGRTQAAARMLDAIREAARQPVTVAPILRDAALPVCEAVLAHAQGDHARAVAVMRPALGGMHRMGGSHAQQDVLEQLFLDAALAAGAEEDARMLLERVAGRHPVPPERRAGYAGAARAIRH